MDNNNFACDLNILPASIFTFLRYCGKLAQSLNCRAFIVGGFVRDMLLRHPSPDLDLVIEGNAQMFADELAKKLSGKVQHFKKYLTAKVECNIEGQIFLIDIATARKEHYAFPGARPEVIAADIASDLARRDFSINAMAISLDDEQFGVLLDPFEGRAAIKDKVVDILHDKSCLDDPVRCFRAVRFEQRYGFTITDKTMLSMQRACASTAFPAMPKARIFLEFQHIFEEAQRCACLARLHQIGLFKSINFTASPDSQQRGLWHALDCLLNFLGKFSASFPISCWQAFFECLNFGLDEQLTKANLAALGVPFDAQDKLLEMHVGTAKKMKEIHGDKKPYAICPEDFSFFCDILMDTSNETLVNLLVFSKDFAIKANIFIYIAMKGKLKIDMSDCMMSTFLPGLDSQMPKLERMLAKLAFPCETAEHQNFLDRTNGCNSCLQS